MEYVVIHLLPESRTNIVEHPGYTYHVYDDILKIGVKFLKTPEIGNIVKAWTVSRKGTAEADHGSATKHDVLYAESCGRAEIERKFEISSLYTYQHRFIGWNNIPNENPHLNNFWVRLELCIVRAEIPPRSSTIRISPSRWTIPRRY